MKSILSIGLSPFGLTIAPSITLLFTNWQCIRYGGDTALAAYSVAAYVAGAVDALLLGVGEGLQPLVSYAEGAQDHRAARRLFHRGIRLSLCISGTLCIICILFRYQLGDLFGCSAQVREMLGTAMFFTPLAFPLVGLSRLSSSYLYAGGAHRFSGVLIYLDPLFIAPSLLLLLPTFLSVTGIWVSYPSTYVIMIILAALMVHCHERKKAGSK